MKKVKRIWTIASHVFWNAKMLVCVKAQIVDSCFCLLGRCGFRSISLSPAWQKSGWLCAAWKTLLKQSFAASLLLWLIFIIFKTNRNKAPFKIFKCSVWKHRLVSWQLDTNSQCYSRKTLTQKYSFNNWKP